MSFLAARAWEAPGSPHRRETPAPGLVTRLNRPRPLEAARSLFAPGTVVESLSCMAKQYGNSGRGTDGPAPHGNEDRDQAKTPGANHDHHRDAAGSSGDEFHKSRDAGKPTHDEGRQSSPQPGGATHSESEKPSSPDSRWGGGNG